MAQPVKVLSNVKTPFGTDFDEIHGHRSKARSTGGNSSKVLVGSGGLPPGPSVHDRGERPPQATGDPNFRSGGTTGGPTKQVQNPQKPVFMPDKSARQVFRTYIDRPEPDTFKKTATNFQLAGTVNKRRKA